MSKFQIADWISEQEAYDEGGEDMMHCGEMTFNDKNDYEANIAFMERELEYHIKMAREVREVMAEKKEIIKQKLKKLNENKTLSKKEKEIKKRKIMNTVFRE